MAAVHRRACMSKRLSFTCAGASALVFAGFACGRADEVTRQAALTATASVIAPSTLTFTSGGGMPGGQSVAGLAAQQLSGTSDVWSAYVGFGPSARAVADYT